MASALTIAVILTVSGAVLRALHATSLVDDRAALADDALNVIADVRSATVYDAPLRAKLAGSNATSTRARSGGGEETIVVAVDARANTVTVTASDGDASASESRRLYDEAPPPGSTTP